VTQTATRNELAKAVLELLNGPTGLGGMATPRTAYEYDDAPTTGGDYVLIGLYRVAGGNRRVGGELSPSLWELSVRAVGSVTNVGVLLHHCTRALEYQSITVGDETSTGMQFLSESATAQDEDDLRLYFGDRDFSFAF
jgi:hypothetical protein